MSAQSNITAVKDCVGIVREVAIIIAVLVIVLDPGFLVNWAKSANEEAKKAEAKSTEVNLGPVKIAFDNSTDQAAKLQAALKANEALKKNAEQLINTARNTQTVQSAKEILYTADSLSVTLQAGISSAKTAALAQDQLIQDAPDCDRCRQTGRASRLRSEAGAEARIQRCRLLRASGILEDPRPLP